jgi:long-chain acyl-CoA synthetase
LRVPRLIEKLHARIKSQVEVGGTLKRALGRWAMKIASGPDTLAKNVSRNLADTFVYRKMRDALGGQLNCLIVGGAALSDDLARFLTNIGLPVYTGYGLTEASPVIAVNAPGLCRIGTVGKPFPGVEVRLGEQNKEILARGPNIMQGYYRNQQATDETIDKEGWLHTGDQGEFDADGFLRITGRIKELLKTSNGKYVSPVPIELALAKSPLIDQAMVIAEGRQFVSCLLFPDHDYLHRRKGNDGKAGLTDDAFLQTPEIRAEVEALLGEVNASRDHHEKVCKYRFVLTPPSVERDDLTPTMKIRRHIVCEKYRELIDEMYSENSYAEPLESKEAG